MLKQLIQRLLDSRTTPTEAAHSAMPNVTEQVIATTDQQAWGIVAEGVAPYDCYLMAQGRATSDVSELRAWNKTADIYNQVVASRTNQTQGCCVPVAKGNSWQIFASNRDVTVARYISLIGGGYNLFVWRALSCLKPSFNYLLKVFSRIRKVGLATSPCQRQKTLSFINLRESNGFILLRQAMVICTSWRKIPPVSTLRLGQSALSLLRTLTLLQKFLSPQRKARSSIASFMAVLQQTRQLLLLFTPSVQLNKNLGGATC